MKLVLIIGVILAALVGGGVKAQDVKNCKDSSLAAGRINICISHDPAVYDNYSSDGHAKSCKLSVAVGNATPYHIDRLTFFIASTEVRVPEVYANVVVELPGAYPVSVPEHSTCADQLAKLVVPILNPGRGACSIPNVREGDCQSLIRFTTDITPEYVQSLRTRDQRHLAEMRARMQEQQRAAETAEKERRDARMNALRALNAMPIPVSRVQFAVRIYRFSQDPTLIDRNDAGIGPSRHYLPSRDVDISPFDLYGEVANQEHLEPGQPVKVLNEAIEIISPYSNDRFTGIMQWVVLVNPDGSFISNSSGEIVGGFIPAVSCEIHPTPDFAAAAAKLVVPQCHVRSSTLHIEDNQGRLSLVR